MKKIYTVLVILFAIVSCGNAQEKKEGQKIPSINIKSLKGEVFNTANIDNNGKPIVIIFWALWCGPCIRELTAISEVYEDWQAETGVKIIALSIDDARSQPKVQPTVNGKGWTYEVYCDPNQDFMRAMGVNMPPHLFVLNGNKEIVYQHTSYSEGSEAQLFEVIKKVAKGEKVSSDH